INHYHTDINTWICSCTAFLYSPYMLCKHLIKEYTVTNQLFFPRFLATSRRHDYPFITFGEINNPRINAINNPWNNVLQNKALETKSVSKSSSTQNTSVLVTNRYEIIENRKDELNSDLKMFEMLVKIVSNNIE